MSTTYAANARRLSLVWLTHRQRMALALLSTLTGLATFYLAGGEVPMRPLPDPSPLGLDEVVASAPRPVTDSQRNLALCEELLCQAEGRLAADNTAEAEFHKRRRAGSRQAAGSKTSSSSRSAARR